MAAPKIRKLPVVAVVGRTNVGKSTFWNRVTETGRALVSPDSHTTRDRNSAPAIWRGGSFELVDTGGMDVEKNIVGENILKQADLASKQADLVIFMVDAKTGIVPEDLKLARRVEKLNNHIILVANKADDLRNAAGTVDKAAHALHFGEPLYCSAATSRGLGDILDRVYEELTKMDHPPTPSERNVGLKLVVMGRPNAGKSSLVNAILGEERVIVSPVAHTTREPIDTAFEWKGEAVTLVDTAGMRKRANIKEDLDEEALERNRQALKRADIALLVVDVTEQPGQLDKRLAGLMRDETKGLIIVANKWDLVPDKVTDTVKKYEMAIRRAFPFLNWAPIMFVSATENQRATKLLDLAFTIRDERRRQISYNALQRLLKTVVARKKPLAESGTFSPYLHDVTQIGVEPPKFLITVRGAKANVHVSWIKYFENRLREKFGFQGTPIIVSVKMLPMQSVAERSDEQKKKVTDGKKKNPWRRKKPIGRKGMRY